MKKLAIASALAMTLTSAAFAAQPASTSPYFSLSGVYSSDCGGFGVGLGVTMPGMLKAGTTVGFSQAKLKGSFGTLAAPKDSQTVINVSVHAGYPIQLANNLDVTLGAMGAFEFANNKATGAKAPMTFGAYASLAYQLSPAAHVFVSVSPYAYTTSKVNPLKAATAVKKTENDIFSRGTIGLAWDIR